MTTDYTDFTDENPDSHPCIKLFVSCSGAKILCGELGELSRIRAARSENCAEKLAALLCQ